MSRFVEQIITWVACTYDFYLLVWDISLTRSLRSLVREMFQTHVIISMYPIFIVASWGGVGALYNRGDINIYMPRLLCNGCDVTTKMGHFHGIHHLSHSYAWDIIFIPLGNLISTSASPR